MAKELVSDELWEFVEPLLPEEPPKPKGGRPRLDDRAALTGILFVLKSGIPWEMLPQEMGCGSGVTCWRRLREWHEAGVWEKLHRVLLDRLGETKQIDWERASLDSASVAAKREDKEPERSRQRRDGPARSAMLWSRARASRYVWPALPPMSTIRWSSRSFCTLSSRLRVREADRENAPIRCTPTKPA